MGASNGPIRQRTAMAMGQKATVGTAKVPFSGAAGQGSTAGVSKKMPTTMPSQSQVVKPKGAK